MSVDASCIVAYGVFWENCSDIKETYKESDKLFTYKDMELSYDYKVMEDKGFIVRTEPYCGDWTFLGVEFIADTPEETIENLKHVKEKWEELYKDLLEAIPDDKVELKERVKKLNNPSIVSEAFFS